MVNFGGSFVAPPLWWQTVALILYINALPPLWRQKVVNFFYRCKMPSLWWPNDGTAALCEIKCCCLLSKWQQRTKLPSKITHCCRYRFIVTYRWDIFTNKVPFDENHFISVKIYLFLFSDLLLILHGTNMYQQTSRCNRDTLIFQKWSINPLDDFYISGKK